MRRRYADCPRARRGAQGGPGAGGKSSEQVHQAGWRTIVSTKADLNHRRVQQARDLDDLVRLLFPSNKNHQRTALAIMVELKWAEDQFLPALQPIAQAHGITPRTLETVRAKMRRLGLIDHVSRFNKKHGYREGWIFSNRFQHSLDHLAKLTTELRSTEDPAREKKDRLLLNMAASCIQG